jgi:hypothetical protein
MGSDPMVDQIAAGEGRYQVQTVSNCRFILGISDSHSPLTKWSDDWVNAQGQ